MKIPKILFIGGLFIAFAFVVALIVIGINSANTNRKSTDIGSAKVDSLNSEGVNSNDINSSKEVLNNQEVSKHAIKEDCWTIVNGKVYDVTSLSNSHSGGSEAILNNCGKDGSYAFNTKYGKGNHSSGANVILASYYVGDLVI